MAMDRLILGFVFFGAGGFLIAWQSGVLPACYRALTGFWDWFSRKLAWPSRKLGITSLRAWWARYLLLFFFVGVLMIPAILSLYTPEVVESWLPPWLQGRWIDILLHPVAPAIGTTGVYVLILSINRAWALNEQLREEIAAGVKRLKRGTDSLPDLVDEGIVAALLLIPLIPIWLASLDQAACHIYGANHCIYSGLRNPDSWVLYGIEMIARGSTLFDFSEVYGWGDWSRIDESSFAALHLKMFVRATVDIVLIFAFVEFFRVTKETQLAVASLGTESGRAARVGARMVRHLEDQIASRLGAANQMDVAEQASSESEDDNELGDTYLRNAAVALGQIGDMRAYAILAQLAVQSPDGWLTSNGINKWFVRLAAVKALGELAWSQKRNSHIGGCLSIFRKQHARRSLQKVLGFLDRRLTSGEEDSGRVLRELERIKGRFPGFEWTEDHRALASG